MAKKKGRKAKAQAALPPQTVFAPKPGVYAVVALVAALVIFYWIPLTSQDATIHWDAVDVHYSSQKYFSNSVLEGKLPHWTPYIFSGFPFLADPQTAAWYPLHWPVFLVGVTPKGIQFELMLHCLIALLGTYLFVREYFPHHEVAVLAALVYAFSGYFAGHSSDIGNFGAAAWLPLLLLSLQRAVLTGKAEWFAVAGLVVGLNALLGHFQTTLYCLFAAGMFCFALAIEHRKRLVRALLAPAATAIAGLLVAAVLVVPGLQLTSQSIRSGMTFSGQTNAPLAPSSLGTLLLPNALGAIEGPYEGPADITQFYFYAGFLLLPLAAFGCRRTGVLLPGLALIVPAAWYGLGPAAGFYRLLTLVPGFANVRAPVQIWFVIALGLALLAAAGFAALLERWNLRYLALGIPVLFFADLYYWNSAQNPLAYERVSWEESYGAGLRLFRERIGSKQPPLTRFHAPHTSTTFGPLNHPLDTGTEATYGYNPLELLRYREYTEAAKKNPKLLDGLNVSRTLDMERGALITQQTTLPRAHFPTQVTVVASDEEARNQLESLNPAKSAIIVSTNTPTQDANATAAITAYTETSYTIRYRSATRSLLRIAVPYYPGWTASVEGEDLPVIPVDHALMGVVVPAGEHELRIRFHLPGFDLGAAISLLSTIAILAFLFVRRRQLIPAH